MSLPKIAALLVAGALSATGAVHAASAANDPVSDSDLQVALVGSWVIPPDSSNEALVIASRQVFHGDGTTQLFIYPTFECRTPAAEIEGRWWIKDGVLLTQITGTTDPRLIPVGEIQEVVIVAVDEDKVVFHADDQLYVRAKSDRCYPPGSHRT